jgi:hypothetical protein
VAAREIEDGAALVNLGSGACFELNRIGFQIWKALGAGTTVGCARRAVRGRARGAGGGRAALVEALAGARLLEVA